jgi:hypothetical protein
MEIVIVSSAQHRVGLFANTEQPVGEPAAFVVNLSAVEAA